MQSSPFRLTRIEEMLLQRLWRNGGQILSSELSETDIIGIYDLLPLGLVSWTIYHSGRRPVWRAGLTSSGEELASKIFHTH